MIVRPGASPPNGGLTVRLEAGQTVDIDGSFVLSSVRLGRTTTLPTSGYGKSRIEYGLCLNHAGASNLPANKRVRQTASTSIASTTSTSLGLLGAEFAEAASWDRNAVLVEIKVKHGR